MNREKVDHYGATYGKFTENVYARVRREAFGEDIGQTGWLSADEHEAFLGWLTLDGSARLLDVACGSGGPTLRAARRTGARVVGIDLHEDAVRTAARQAEEAGLADRATFQRVDASGRLPFADGEFDALICVDAVNHLPDRAATFREWARVLKPRGRLVFTDPIVVTGALTSSEIAIRSSIGFFLFVPPGLDEQLLTESGFGDVQTEDRTENMASMARRWWKARAAHADDLRAIEGDESFHGQQRFFDTAARLAEERRLSRFAFRARRHGESSIECGMTPAIQLGL